MLQEVKLCINHNDITSEWSFVQSLDVQTQGREGLRHDIANTHKLLLPQKGHKDQPGRTIRKVAGEHAQKQADLDR